MTQLNGRASISIFQLIFYTPAIVAATLLCVKHGFGRSSGWFFLLTVSLFRIAGAATQLVTYSNHSEGVYIASAILGSFGLSALLLACLGLLSRVADSINRSMTGLINPVFFRLVQLVTTVGLILSIVGDTNINFDGATESITLPVETKVGVLLLLIAWILILFVCTAILMNVLHIAEGERRLAWAVLVCLPFLLIRLVYAILVIFLNDKNFSLVFPFTVTLWTLSTIEECFVVFILLLVGFKTPKLADTRTKNFQPAAGTEANPQAYTTDSPAYTAPRQGVQWKGSIILTLIGAIQTLFQHREPPQQQQQQQQQQQDMQHPHQKLQRPHQAHQQTSIV